MRYDYEDIRAKAIRSEATEQDVNALGKWMEQYGDSCWNGEFWDIDDGMRLFPVVVETAPGEYETKGYEIR